MVTSLYRSFLSGIFLQTPQKSWTIELHNKKKGFAAGWILTVITAIIWYDFGDFPNADLVINTKSYIIDILKVLPKVIIFWVNTTTIFMRGKLIIERLLRNFANIFTLNFSKFTQVSVYEQLR